MADHPLPTRLSPTALDRFRQCPQQFFLAHIAHEHRDDSAGPQLVLANAVHHALERFMGVRVEQRTPELLHQALRSVWAGHRQEGAFASRDDERRWGQEGLAMLDGYAERHGLEETPIAREVWVRHRPTRGPQLYGKVDRVDEWEGGLRIVDYKTGRRVLEPEEIRDDSAAMLYAVAAQATYGRPVLRVTFEYLAVGQSVHWELDDPAEQESAGERLAAHVEALIAERDWEARPGGICRFCPFAHLCPQRSAVELGDLEVAEVPPF